MVAVDLRVWFYHTIPGGKLHVSVMNEDEAEAVKHLCLLLPVRGEYRSSGFGSWGLGVRAQRSLSLRSSIEGLGFGV